VAPGSRAEAIAKIRALAQAGWVNMHRRAQQRMEQLGYDVTDVEEFLTELQEDECIGDGPPDHPEFAPQGWVYEFVIDLEGELPLYIKLCLNPSNAYILSFKLEGSPA